MLTSVDKEGTKKGLDIEIIDKISKNTNIPLIACGGVGDISHIKDLCDNVDIDAIALASILHYEIMTVSDIKQNLLDMSIEVRHD